MKASPIISALLVLISGAAFSGCHARSSAPDPQPSRISITYTSKPAGLQQLAIAPDAKAAGFLDEKDRLHIVQPGGREALVYEERGARMVALSNSAERCILAETQRTGWAIRIITISGETLWRQSLSGEVLDVEITPDGKSAFVSTEGQRMYVLDLSDSPKWRRVPTDYTLRQISYNAVADALLVQTRRPMGFGVCTLEGTMRWWKPQGIGKFHIFAGAQGGVIVTLLEHLSPQPGVEVSAYNAAGKRMLSRAIQGYDARAAVSADGKRIAVSFRRKLTHGDKSVMERRIALWGVDGRTVWEQGGLFFKPVLEGLTSDPFGVLVAEDYTLLSAIDRTGKLAWRGPELPGRVMGLTHDENWRLAWAQYTDGSLELWRLG